MSVDVARLMIALSFEIGRQVGLLISREGEIYSVLVGTERGILIPDLSQFRAIQRGLRGIRFLHTHLKNEPLSEEDLTDLALLRLDLIAAIGVLPSGLPGAVFMAHLVPENPEGKIYETHPPLSVHQMNPMAAPWLSTLFSEWDTRKIHDIHDRRERAILISVSKENKLDQEESLAELAELTRSANLNPIESIVQRIKAYHPKTLLGTGKLKEVIMKGVQSLADFLVFDQNLTPLQVKMIGEITEMKVLDRTQVILDIFAQRAVTREAQLQVELAQLRYRLPRLAERSTALSRLTGGIGGRGPGETRLEVDRRRTRDRIRRLEREMISRSSGHAQRRMKRNAREIPILSIVGYTNAGKSTLLNALTQSDVKTGNLLFSTLDTSTRRLRLPREREVIITDTVGFIHAIPPDLLGAFESTFSELKDAHLLLHLVDISSPRLESQIRDVDAILDRLDIGTKPRLMVLNKIDKMDPDTAQILCARYNAMGVSACNPKTLTKLLAAIENRIGMADRGFPYPCSP